MALLEVEAKFLCPPALEALIAAAAGAGYPKRKKLVDSYFDAAPPSFPLLRRDWWLRLRNEAWELKVPAVPLPERVRALERSSGAGEGSGRVVDRYVEVVDPAEIARHLAGALPAAGADAAAAAAAAPPAADFGALVRALGLAPFATVTTQRRSYRVRLHAEGGEAADARPEVGVDVDEVEFEGGGSYALAEVEVMAAPEAGSGAAEQLIARFFRDFGVAPPPPGQPLVGKVLEFLRRCRPVHFAACEDIMRLKVAGATALR
jgi:hypothetical protein